jgi:hypothetical protein
MQRHPQFKYLATGDSKQLQPIDNDIRAETRITKHFNIEYHNKITERMFPRVLHLRDNKRIGCADCIANCGHGTKDCLGCIELRKIQRNTCEMLMNGPRDWREQLMTMHPQMFVNDLDQMHQQKDVASVTYYNRVAEYINQRVKGRTNWMVGDIAICKVHHKMGRKNADHKFTKWSRYVVQKIEGGCVHLRDLYTNKLIPVPRANMQKFSPPHGRTVHSLQGRSVGTKLNIYDMFEERVDHHWAYVAFTRCTTLDIKIYRPTLYRKLLGDDWDKQKNEKIRNKIIDYWRQDEENFGDHIDMWKNDFVKFGEVLELLKRPECTYCREEISSTWTLDRLDNSLPHLGNNVVLSCDACNSFRGKSK